MTILLVVVLGGVGALIRYGLSEYLNHGAFPWGTLTVNLVGSLFLGFLWSMYDRQSPIVNAQFHWALMVGLTGGFTTFSALSLEVVKFIQSSSLMMAFIYILISVLGGVSLCWLGFKWGLAK